MCYYFPKPFIDYWGNINAKVDLSNYATKTDIQNIWHANPSNIVPKTNLASLKTEVDKLDIDKLVPVPVDLSKLSGAAKSDVVRKTAYDKLVAKVNNIDTSEFILKTKYQTDKLELEKGIPDVNDLVKKTKPTKSENKIPDVSGLASKSVEVKAMEI